MFYSKEILLSIAVGAFVALTVEAIHWFFRYREKRGIQTRISEVLVKGFYEIENAEGFEAEMDTKTQFIDENLVRSAQYKNMERSLLSLINHSKKSLDLEDEYTLRYQILFVQQFPLPPNTVFPLKFYRQNFFGPLQEKIKWLDFNK